MARFSDLPNELLVEIGCHVLQPRDVENFALVSKRIRALSAKALLEHRMLTDEFSAYHIGGPKSRRPAARLLKEILTNPRVALYVKHLSITGLRLHRNQYPENSLTEEDITLFQTALDRARHFSSNSTIDHRLQYWRDGIGDGLESPIMVILVMLLTNLESFMIEEKYATWRGFHHLQFIKDVQGLDELKRVIKVIIRNVFDHDPEEALRALPSVTAIQRRILGNEGHRGHLEFNLRVRSLSVESMMCR